VSVPAANAERVERMHRLLAEAFAPTELEVIDDSHRHVGHAGAREGKGHFSVRIVSPVFAGMTPLARHRAVYAALGDMMIDDIHALSIQASVPDPRVP
jgi:BolA protein